MKKIISWMLVFGLVCAMGVTTVNAQTATAAAKAKLTSKTMTIATGKTKTIVVKNKSGATVTFKSKKASIATVTTKGKVKGIKKGTTTIAVTVVKNGKTTKLSCKVVVLKAAKSVSILNASKKSIQTVTLNKNQKVTLKYKCTPASSNDKVKWSTSDSGVATISKDGVIKGISLGTATIYGKTYSGKEDYVDVVVAAKALTTSLKIAYSQYFSIGAALNVNQFYDVNAASLIKGQFSSMTMENAMKPEGLLDYDATLKQGNNEAVCIKKDALKLCLQTAKANGLKLRGHCLVWHSQTPTWFFADKYTSDSFVSKAIMAKRMESYIKQVMSYCQTYYPGVVYAWDVVNEAVADGASSDPDGLRVDNSKWYQVYGDGSFIEQAFQYADKYRASGVKLFYNDYNEYEPTKREKIFTLAKKLFDKGYLDGIGMQSHYDMSYPTIDLVKQAILRYMEISNKLEIQLTEVDMHNTDPTTAGLNTQAKRYGELMTMLVTLDKTKAANITNVTFWGLLDGDSWLSNFKQEDSYPLLFDDDYGPKPSYYAVLAAAK